MTVKKELKGDITEDQLRRVKKEIAESMSRDRHKLLVEQPFIGSVAMRFDLVPVRDMRCLTACTDSQSIYFNCDFYLGLSQAERVFVLAHEIWHSLNLTFARKQTRDVELWNIASDMEINNILVGSGGTLASPPRDLMFPPAKLKGKSAETIYDWLLKQQEKNNLKNALSQMEQPNGGGQQQSGGGGGSDGKLKGQFDKHVYEGQPDDEDENDGKDGKDGKGKNKKDSKGGPTDRWGEMGFDDDFRPRVPQDAAERMREAAISAAQSYMRDHGDLPAGVEGLIDKFTKPQVNWREELAKHVSQCYGGRRQWLPPARRHVYNDMYFQSRRSETINIGVFIDTSGSTMGDLPQFFSELKGLVESFGAYTVHCIHCDAAVDKYEKYDNQENPLNLDDASKVEWSGGGGTSFDPPFKYIEEHNIEIDAAVYMTDGYGPCTVPQPKYPVLWLISPGGTTDFCDWGKKIFFKEPSWE